MPTRPESGVGKRLVRTLRKRGIVDERILAAIGRIPRERFVPAKLQDAAYDDRALEIGCDQTISQPSIVAMMTVDLALDGTERVLEIGTGSGYQTAILALLAADVYTVERHRELSDRARGILDGLGFSNIHYRIGDGTLGLPGDAPFDRAIVTAAAPRIPQPIFDQLVEGGTLVIPLGDETTQHLTAVRKVDGRPVLREGCACRFVPLIGREGWAIDD